MVTNPNEVLETWKAYFQSLLNTKASPPQSQPDSGLGSEVEMDSFLNDPFTLDEIAFALNIINTHSTPGPDNITVAHISKQSLLWTSLWHV